jgi:hypothetical protein
LVGKSEEKKFVGNLGVGGKIILKWLFEKWCVRCGLGSRGSVAGTF